MGIGNWLTNYKQFNVLAPELRTRLTLGNMEHFQSFITRRDVLYIASLGMDHMRLGFDQLVMEECPGVYRQGILGLLLSSADWYAEEGLGLVLNMHKVISNYCDISETRAQLDDAELQARFIDCWCALEKCFAARPAVLFELLNEVRSVDPDSWNAPADRTVRLLCRLSPVRRVLISSTNWNNPDTLCRLRIDVDENIIYTFHSYAPMDFTYQRCVLQQAMCYYNRDMPYLCDIVRCRDFQKTIHGLENAYRNYPRMDRAYLADVLRPAFEFRKAHLWEMLWCGELATIRRCDLRWRVN